MTRENPPPGLPGLEPPAKRGPGRPKGSTNKRSGDLKAYVEARFDGLTPGQQAAEIGLVTAKERRAAGSTYGAMVAKAKQLATDLGIKPAEAWRLMQQERADLMPYLHQRLAQLDVTSGGERMMPLIIMPDAPPQQNQGVIDMDLIEVSPIKSHDEAEG